MSALPTTAAANANRREFAVPPPGFTDVPGQPITVLLLEDDPDVLEATAMILQEEGFRVLATADLETAQRLALEAQRCVVLLDLSIEGDLLRFVQTLHHSAAWDGQVLLFSAGDRLEERARELEADGAVAKPFEIDRLIAELRFRGSLRDEAHAS